MKVLCALLFLSTVTPTCIALTEFNRLAKRDEAVDGPTLALPQESRASKELLFLVNHPLRADVWALAKDRRSKDGGIVQDHYQDFDFDVKSDSDTNRIIALAAELKAKIHLETGKVLELKAPLFGTFRPPVVFRVGTDWTGKATPPTLTIYVEYPNVRIDRLKIPKGISVETGKQAQRSPGGAAAKLIRKLIASREKRDRVIPAGSTEWRGNRYFIFSEPMTPNEARRHCESLGGHLARIETEAEYQFVVDLLGRASVEQEHPYCWVDGSDERVEGTWVYSDGKPLAYHKWSPDSPDGYPNEHSLCIDFRDMLFSDANTSWRCVFLCEWDSQLPLAD